MNFDDFVNSLSDEQKQKLMQGLMEAAEKPPVKVKARDLPSRKSKDQKQEEKVSSTPKKNVTEDFKMIREKNTLEKRKIPVRAKQNKFSDEGFERDPDFDPSKYENKTPRRRKPTSKKNVECHVCGKSFSMNSSLVCGEFIRCNRCTGR